MTKGFTCCYIFLTDNQRAYNQHTLHSHAENMLVVLVVLVVLVIYGVHGIYSMWLVWFIRWNEPTARGDAFIKNF